MLTHVPTAGPFAGLLSDWLDRNGLRHARFWSHQRAFLDLAERDPAGRAAYLGHLSSRKRRKLRQAWDRLNAEGAVTAETIRAPADLPAAIDDYIALEGAGWKGRRGTAIADDPAQAAMILAAVTAFGAHGAVRIDRLRRDGRTLAAVVSFVTRGRLWSLKISYDAAAARHSPGALAFHQLTQGILADPAITSADSCAPPNYVLPETFWTERLPLAHILVETRGGDPLFPLAAALERGRAAANVRVKAWRDRVRAWRGVGGSTIRRMRIAPLILLPNDPFGFWRTRVPSPSRGGSSVATTRPRRSTGQPSGIDMIRPALRRPRCRLGLAEIADEAGRLRDEASAHCARVGVRPLDGVVDLRGVVADHLHRPYQEVEAARGHPGGERLHRHQGLGDQVGQPLDRGGFSVVRVRRGQDHVEAVGPAQERGDPPGAPAAHFAEGDPGAAQALFRALRPEQRVRRHDGGMRRQAVAHGPRRHPLHRADIEDEDAGPQVRADRRHHVRDGRDGGRQDDHRTGGRLGEAAADDVIRDAAFRQRRS